MLILSKPLVAVATTWSPTDQAAGWTLSNGNLTASYPSNTAWTSIRSTLSKSSGKWYFEAAVTQVNSNGWMIGVGTATANLNSYSGSGTQGTGFELIDISGYVTSWYAGVNTDYHIGAPASGDVIAVCLDVPNNRIWWNDLTKATGWTNGAGGTGGDPANGTGYCSFPGAAGSPLFIMGSASSPSGQSNAITLNTGPAGFVGTPPNTFLAWA